MIATNIHCYAGYSWRVFQNNRFVGYIVALSETDAYRRAQDKYGSYIWIEKMVGQSGPVVQWLVYQAFILETGVRFSTGLLFFGRSDFGKGQYDADSKRFGRCKKVSQEDVR